VLEYLGVKEKVEEVVENIVHIMNRGKSPTFRVLETECEVENNDLGLGTLAGRHRGQHYLQRWCCSC
jgi:hypothetical protein